MTMNSTQSDSLGSPINQNINRALSISFATILILTPVVLLLRSIFGLCHRSPSSASNPAVHDQNHHVVDVGTGPRPESEPGQASCSVNHLLESTIPAVIYVVEAGDSDESCCICLAEFSNGDTVRVLPKCKHVFHKDCIDQWMPNRSSFCPVCRERAIERDAEPPKTNCTNNGAPGSVILNFGNNSHIPSFL